MLFLIGSYPHMKVGAVIERNRTRLAQPALASGGGLGQGVEKAVLILFAYSERKGVRTEMPGFAKSACRTGLCVACSLLGRKEFVQQE